MIQTPGAQKMRISPLKFATTLMLSLLAVSALAAGKNEAPKLMMFSSTVKLDVANTGQVIAAGADAALPDAVRSAIEAGAKRWRFSPPTRDGRPVAGVTWVKSGSYRPEQLDGQPVVTRISTPVEFVGGQQFKVNSKSDAIALSEESRRERATRNEACETAMGLRDKADRQVAIDSPFKPVFTN